jgi:hypothetical protein
MASAGLRGRRLRMPLLLLLFALRPLRSLALCLLSDHARDVNARLHVRHVRQLDFDLQLVAAEHYRRAVVALHNPGGVVGGGAGNEALSLDR